MTTEYPKAASIVALTGGIIILLAGVFFTAVSAIFLPYISYTNVHVPQGLNPASIPAIVSGVVGVMGAFGLVSGAIVLISSVMLLTNSSQRRVWGALILVFSALSFFGTGGFIIGAVLGIVGGALTLLWRAPTR
jgi:hypothetical protein